MKNDWEIVTSESNVMLAAILMASASNNLIKAIARYSDNTMAQQNGETPRWDYASFMELSENIEGLADVVSEAIEGSDNDVS